MYMGIGENSYILRPIGLFRQSGTLGESSARDRGSCERAVVKVELWATRPEQGPTGSETLGRLRYRRRRVSLLKIPSALSLLGFRVRLGNTPCRLPQAYENVRPGRSRCPSSESSSGSSVLSCRTARDWLWKISPSVSNRHSPTGRNCQERQVASVSNWRDARTARFTRMSCGRSFHVTGTHSPMPLSVDHGRPAG